MCLICVELTKDKLTSNEARRNLGEMRASLTKEHVHEVLNLIWKKEDEEENANLPPSEDEDWSWDGWGSD
tara:strand:- start:313 stop:522 length:210 start_codon:yes stop_codon:yes gene_type:complete